MPLYEYRCRTCDDTFELRRSMSDSNAPAPCPSGHTDSVRLLSVFASAVSSSGRASSSSARSSGAPGPAPQGGGCGSSCGCHG